MPLRRCCITSSACHAVSCSSQSGNTITRLGAPGSCHLDQQRVSELGTSEQTVLQRLYLT